VTVASRKRWPTVDVDLYSRDTLSHPHEAYRAIREAGPVVWLPRNRVWAMGRFADVRAALRNDVLYRSGDGVSLNVVVNRLLRKTTLGSDGETHSKRRKVLMHSLDAKALARIEPVLDTEADAAVEDLLRRQSFDGVADFASRLPVRVVGDLVGLQVDRNKLLSWGRGSFDGNGPMTNWRVLRATPTAISVWLYTARLNQSRVTPGSWASFVLAASERGELGRSEAKNMVIDFVGPSLDTTILATAQLLWSLGENPGAWNRVRRHPELIPKAVVEAVRLASPVRGFMRTLARDDEIDGIKLQAGQRVALLFASANMDEEQFPNPGRFDLDRRGGNLGWGHGAHTCVGMHLSKLEMEALLRAMTPRVGSVQVWRPRRLINNGLQGLRTFQARFQPATPARFGLA